ncbi:MAG TPA: serine/threonine-protein kinase, partial [Ktedonobacteraceae bacterium]
VYCAQCGAANAYDVECCFACGLPLSADSATSSSSALLHGRYRLLHQLGSGGYGAVYKAVDVLAGEYPVALKIISLRGLKPQDVIDATDTFHRELNILSELRHRSLPCLYEHFTDKEHWYLVMEFIEGETLENLLLTQSSSLSLLEVCHIGMQLCSVLEYLHTREPAVIFRDLKPANVMITPFKQVYLIDFGTARLFKPGRSRDTIALGSPGYASPEQYGTAQTTPRSDIYSLGATLHQLLTGIDPAHDPFNFAPLISVNPSLPVELSVLLSRMLSLYPEERPASMNEVKAALQDLAVKCARRLAPVSGTFSPFAQPDSRFTPSEPFTVNEDAPIIWSDSGETARQVQMQQPREAQPEKPMSLSRRMVMVGLFSLAVCGAGVLSQRASEETQHRRDRYHRHHRRSRMGADLSSTSVTSLAWIASSGFLASRSTNGTLIVANAFSGQNITSFTGPAQEGITAFAAMHHSCQSSLLAIGLNGHGIALWDSMSNLLVQQGKGTSFSAPVRALAWSFDDRHLAVAEGNQIHLFSYHPYTSEFLLERDLVGHDASVSCLAWSPDGSFLASGSEDQTIRLWSMDSDTSQVYLGHRGSILSIDWSLAYDPETFYGLASCATDGQVQ